MKLKFRITAIASLAFMLAVPASTRADGFIDWNAIAVQTTVPAGRPGPTAVLDLALFQAAVYEAVQAPGLRPDGRAVAGLRHSIHHKEPFTIPCPSAVRS